MAEIKTVLILIFLENALRLPSYTAKNPRTGEVLILIFLENALRHNIINENNDFEVLILIFLENALRQTLENTTTTYYKRS